VDRDWRHGQEPGELDVGVESYLLRVVFEIPLRCSVFITALIVVCIVLINIVVFVRPRAYLLQYVLLTKYSGD
jgi:hypothetical protein